MAQDAHVEVSSGDTTAKGGVAASADQRYPASMADGLEVVIIAPQTPFVFHPKRTTGSHRTNLRLPAEEVTTCVGRTGFEPVTSCV